MKNGKLLIKCRKQVICKGEEYMEKKLNTIKLSLMISLCFVVLGCKSVLYEIYDIQEDVGRKKVSTANIEDSLGTNHAGVGVSFWERGTTHKFKGGVVKSGEFDQIVYHNPYEIDISIGAPKHITRGRMSEIEVKKCYFEILFLNGKSTTLNIGINRKDWVKQEYDSPKGNPVISFATGLRDKGGSFRGVVDIDYTNLKEVRFYIKYVGIYENGERREYWQERYYVPKFVSERRNWFERLSSL